MRTPASCCALIMAVSLTNCGTTSPDFTHLGAKPVTTPAFVKSVAGYVRCVIAHEAYIDQQQAPWLINWSAVVDLTLFIDQQSVVSPDALLTRYLPGQSKTFSNGTRVDVGRRGTLGLGASATTDAKRTLKVSWYEDFAELIAEQREILQHPNHDCSKLGTYPVTGDIKFADTLGSAVFVTTAGGIVSRDDLDVGPLKVVEHQVTFQVDVSANATPAITLFDIALNPAPPFLNASSVQRSDLLISMGPVAPKDVIPLSKLAAEMERRAGPRRPSADVLNSNLAATIGMSVGR